MLGCTSTSSKFAESCGFHTPTVQCAGSKHAAFAHDPRADPAVLQPEWHEKHADFRVKKTVDAPPAKPPGGLFAAHAQKRVKFDVERRTDDRASEWSPLDAK